MADIIKIDYEGHKISFEFADGNKMINATEMAKPFGKLVGNFLKSQHARDFIQLLENRYSIWNIGSKREVLRVVKGGDAYNEIQGTWMDEKLALKFAAWLSPAFELWVYDKIQELLTTGKTELKKFRQQVSPQRFGCLPNSGKSRKKSTPTCGKNWTTQRNGSTNWKPKS
ncbi:MAG: KilA-N domain-containing protein [Saprospiraceae bacterium]|nr:KilA-N domain-containing protein [Saprospiraceae bacterium]